MNEVETVAEEATEGTAESSKKELGRKFFVFLVWILIVIAVAVLVGFNRLGEDIFSQALNSFYIISVVYIGGNVTQKVGKYVASAIEKKSEGEK